MAAVVDRGSCIACGTCQDICPANAITIDSCAHVNGDACIECGACENTCPEGAIAIF